MARGPNDDGFGDDMLATMVSLTIRRQAVRSAKTGQMLLASISDFIRDDASLLAPMLPIALGWLTQNDLDQTWLSMKVTPLAARMVSEQWALVNRKDNMDARYARAAGELVATWACGDSGNQAQDNARQQLLRVFRAELRRRPVVIQNAIRSVTRAMNHPDLFMGQSVPNVYIVGIPAGQDVPLQTHEFWKLAGAGVSHTIVNNQELQAAWFNLCHNLDPDAPVAIPEVEVNLRDDIDAFLVMSSDDDILCLLEMIGRDDSTKLKLEALSAVFIGLAVLCKGRNVTSAWISSRLERLTQEIPGIDLTNQISDESIGAFNDLYPRDQLDHGTVQRHLQMAYMFCAIQGLQSFNWMVEQAASSNITPLTALAAACTRGPTLNWKIPFGEPAISSELRALAKASAEVLIDTYSTIVKPPVTVREYADLGFIGLEIRKEQDGRDVLGTYQNGLRGMVKLSPKRLLEIVRQMMDRSEVCDEGVASVEEILAGQGASRVYEAQDYYYVVPDATQPPTRPPGAEGIYDGIIDDGEYHIGQWLTNTRTMSTQGVIDAVNQTLDVQFAALTPEQRNDAITAGAIEALRGQWIGNMRNLPPQAYRISAAKAERYALDIEDTRVSAFKIIMAAVEGLAQQHAKLCPSIRVNRHGQKVLVIPSWQTELPDDVRDAVVTLGVTEAEIPTPNTNPQVIAMVDTAEPMERPRSLHPDNAQGAGAQAELPGENPGGPPPAPFPPQNPRNQGQQTVGHGRGQQIPPARGQVAQPGGSSNRMMIPSTQAVGTPQGRTQSGTRNRAPPPPPTQAGQSASGLQTPVIPQRNRHVSPSPTGAGNSPRGDQQSASPHSVFSDDPINPFVGEMADPHAIHADAQGYAAQLLADTAHAGTSTTDLLNQMRQLTPEQLARARAQLDALSRPTEPADAFE